jgi:hypothetical protein
LLPYVECDARGLGARPDRCAQVGVKRYPTWTIDGQRYEGVQTIEQLATASKFPAPEPR